MILSWFLRSLVRSQGELALLPKDENYESKALCVRDFGEGEERLVEMVNSAVEGLLFDPTPVCFEDCGSGDFERVARFGVFGCNSDPRDLDFTDCGIETADKPFSEFLTVERASEAF